MTQPSLCIPGTTYLITRTCSDRRYLCRPDPTMSRIFGYCLGRALAVSDMQVHAVSVESNHYHMVATSLTAEALSDFMELLNRSVSRCLMARYAERFPDRTLEAVWSRGSFNAAALVSREAVVGAIAYTLTIP